MPQIKFIKSSSILEECPPGSLPEYAFIGRSNVGKSSLINMLMQRNKVAHTSSKPGKTRVINHFIVDDAWYLVDLPGYGYAKVAKTERRKWDGMSMEYLTGRPNLVCVFLLVDLRIKPQLSDFDFMEKLVIKDVPFALVFTKAEKMSKIKIEAALSEFSEKVKSKWNDMPDFFTSSAKSGLGRKEILKFILNLNTENK